MGTITSLMMTPPPRHQTWVMIPLPRLQTALWIGQSTPAGDAWLGPGSIPSSVEIVSRKHQVKRVAMFDVWQCCLVIKHFQTLLTCTHQLPPSPAGAAPRAPPPDPSAAGGAPRPAPTWPRVTANPPHQPLLLLPDQDQEVKGVGLVPVWPDQDHSMLTAMNMTITHKSAWWNRIFLLICFHVDNFKSHNYL